MKALVLVAFLFLAGCSAVGELIPSLRYCSDVAYKRTGTDIDIQAKCRAPVG